MKTIPKGLCTELIILTRKWMGTETALNYMTILIDFGGNFLLCNQTWFHQSMSIFFFGMQELRTWFFNPRSPRYYLTLIWFLSSSCSSLFRFSSFESLLPTFPGLAGSWFPHIPVECCPSTTDHLFTFPGCPSIPSILGSLPDIPMQIDLASFRLFVWALLGHFSFLSYFLLPSLIILGMCLL